MTISTTLTEIAKRRHHDAWLQTKLSELEAEIANISADRNRLIFELSRARNKIYRLLSGIHETLNRIRCHFSRHLRRQVAVACCAINMGCPFIGVCFQSFLGMAGANLVVMKSTAWDRMVSMPLFWMYCRSSGKIMVEKMSKNCATHK